MIGQTTSSISRSTRQTRRWQTHPEQELGIRHDIAEIESVVGGNYAMWAFVLGEDDTSDKLSEKRRLLDRAEQHLNTAIAAARGLQNAYVLGRAYDWLAAVHFVREENIKVIDNLLLAKEQIEKTANPDWLLPILGSIGDFHKRWGELRAAQQAYLESLRIIAGNTTNGKYADTYHNIGTFYYDLGDFHRAKDYVETSIQLSRATGRETRAYTEQHRACPNPRRRKGLRSGQGAERRSAGLFRANGRRERHPALVALQNHDAVGAEQNRT